MHESANIILAHWHYFNCSVDPETLEEKARAKSPLKELTAEQFETVKGVWQKARLQRADAESQERNECECYQLLAWRLLVAHKRSVHSARGPTC